MPEHTAAVVTALEEFCVLPLCLASPPRAYSFLAMGEPTQKKADTERMILFSPKFVSTKDNMMMVAGEITTQAKLDYDKILCDFVTQIGFDSSKDNLTSVDNKMMVAWLRYADRLRL